MDKLAELKLGLLLFMIDRTAQIDVKACSLYRQEVKRRLRDGVIYECEIPKGYSLS